jgi:hypothetical protein
MLTSLYLLYLCEDIIYVMCIGLRKNTHCKNLITAFFYYWPKKRIYDINVTNREHELVNKKYMHYLSYPAWFGFKISLRDITVIP